MNINFLVLETLASCIVKVETMIFIVWNNRKWFWIDNNLLLRNATLTTTLALLHRKFILQLTKALIFVIYNKNSKLVHPLGHVSSYECYTMRKMHIAIKQSVCLELPRPPCPLEWLICAIICIIQQWTFRYWHCVVSISASNIWNCAARASEFYSNTTDPICVFHWHSAPVSFQIYSDISRCQERLDIFFYPRVVAAVQNACWMKKKKRSKD